MLVVRHDFMNNGRSPNAIGNMLLVNRPRGHPWHHGDADQRRRRTALPRHPARHSRPTLPTDTLDRASIVVGTVTVIPLRASCGNYVLGFTRRRSRLGDAHSAHLAVHHSEGLNSVAFFEPVVGPPTRPESGLSWLPGYGSSIPTSLGVDVARHQDQRVPQRTVQHDSRTPRCEPCRDIT